MTTKIDIAVKLRSIPVLHKKAVEIHSFDMDKQVELGIITGEEREVFEAARAAHNEVERAKDKAVRRVPYPDQSAFAPKEFLSIAEEAKGLRSQYDARREVFRAVGQLIGGSWSTDNASLCVLLGLDDLAKDLLDKVRYIPDADYEKLMSLEHSLENKSRAGTIVARERAKAWDRYGKATKAAEGMVQASMFKKYGKLFAKEQRIKDLIQQRVVAMLEPIRVEMRDTLELALRAVEKETKKEGGGK